MTQINVVGNGNVAHHLIAVFSKINSIKVVAINSRNVTNIKKADITVIAVSDNAIKNISDQLIYRDELIVHTSGAVSINAIASTRKGVFYPLQSFTKDKTIDFSNVPFCIEAINESDLLMLKTLANLLNSKVYHINSEQRKKLHLAAVFVNNFTNHMYAIGKDICDTHEVPFEILFPLIEETAKKIITTPPKTAQTGPAKRNDYETIQNHLENLNLQQQEIYKLITKSIQEN